VRTQDLPGVFRILRSEAEKYDPPVSERQHAYKDAFRVLVSVLLSARTKDSTTDQVVERLFRRVKSPLDLATLPVGELERLLKPVGFYRTKAKHLKETSRMILEEFEGKIPRTMNELLRLPGIGRKSANLVIGLVFGDPAICVDTHVHRITNRWGYVRTGTPLETETALRKRLPRKYWIEINRLLVIYGQNVCTPLSPYCSRCRIEKYCRKVGVSRTR
jgi:endonuclease-3